MTTLNLKAWTWGNTLKFAFVLYYKKVLWVFWNNSPRHHFLINTCIIQYSLARVITNTSKYQHITPTLKTLHWIPIEQRIDYKLCLLTYTKHLQISNLHIFTIVFHSRHILFLQDLRIHLFFPFNMSYYHLAKGLSLSSVHDSEIHSFSINETRLLIQYSVPSSKHTSSKLLSLPRLFSHLPGLYPGFDSCYFRCMP